MHRRKFLSVSAGLLWGEIVAAGLLPEQIGVTFYSAASDKHNKPAINAWSYPGSSFKSIALTFRAHDVVLLDQQSLLVFGRRPGVECARIQLEDASVVNIKADPGRHFYGHGCLQPSGRVLFTTENDYENAQGKVVVRDTDTLRVLAEYPSGGIGPHDIHYLSQHNALVVANGGIQTHPEFGRRKLNLKQMQPSLTYLDADSGKILEQQSVNHHQLSIRHLCIKPGGGVGVAMQFQGNVKRDPPQSLLAWDTAGGNLNLLPMPREHVLACRGYMADLAYDSQRQILMATSPRGNRVCCWDMQTQQYLSHLSLPEPSGIQYSGILKAFIVSSARGAIYQLRAQKKQIDIVDTQWFSQWQWDNHLALT